MLGVFPGYARYAREAGRELPVVLLTPAGTRATSPDARASRASSA
jgi:hypothetical protein